MLTISLITPTVYALKEICDTFLECASEYDSKPSNCLLIKYGSRRGNPYEFDGIRVKYKLHLIHIIGPSMHMPMVKDVFRDFIWRLNALLVNFGCYNSSIKRQWFMAYCTSCYGVCLWNLQEKYVNEFYTTWRKDKNKLVNLPGRTHCNMVPLLAESLPIQI